MSTFLLRGLPLAGGQLDLAFGDFLGEFGALFDPQPKRSFGLTAAQAGAGAWTLRITIDLGLDVGVDTVALLHHTGIAGGLISLHARTSAEGPFAAPDGGESSADALFTNRPWRAEPPADAARFHFVEALPAVVSRRHVRLVVTWPGPDPCAPWTAGVLMLGKRFQPGGALGGFDWGAGRRIADLSTVRMLPGGERGIWKAARVPEVRGSFSHLTDGELAEAWALLRGVGESDPLLLVEAPDTLGAASLHDRIHYGTLTGLDFFERRMADKSRIEFRLQHWL